MLDTFVPDLAPSDLPLWPLPHVANTPHLAPEQAAADLRRCLTGEPPRTPC